jgi:hypothetical protein
MWPLRMTAATTAIFIAGCATGGTASPPAPATANSETAPVAIMVPRRPVSTTDARRNPAKPPSSHAVSGPCRVNRDSVEWTLVSGGCRKGRAQGPGRARSVDGHRSYSGGFVAGYFDGEGSYDWGNGVRYTGAFVRGKKSGKGVISYPGHRRYRGQFKDDLYDGTGRYEDEDGSAYEGEFRLGRFEGHGTYTWPNGDQYVGEFKDNRMDGKGVYIQSSGERHAGRFRNNEITTGQVQRIPGPN